VLPFALFCKKGSTHIHYVICSEAQGKFVCVSQLKVLPGKTITHLYSDPAFKPANQMMWKLATKKECQFLSDIACLFFFLLHRVCATIKIKFPLKFQFNVVVTKDTDFVLTLKVCLFIFAQAPTFSCRCECLIGSYKILSRTRHDF
jgi:hypothetical protein